MSTKRYFGLIGFLILVLTESVSIAANGDANFYAEKCRAAIAVFERADPTSNLSNADSMNIASCAGVMNGMLAANEVLKETQPADAFCAPKSIDSLALARAFIATFEKNPTLKYLDGVPAVQASLRIAFPCKVKNDSRPTNAS